MNIKYELANITLDDADAMLAQSKADINQSLKYFLGDDMFVALMTRANAYANVANAVYARELLRITGEKND